MDFYDDLERFKLKTQHHDVFFKQFSAKNGRGSKRTNHPIYKQLESHHAHGANAALATVNFDELSTTPRAHVGMPESKRTSEYNVDVRPSVVIFDSVSKMSAKRSAERLARQVHSEFSDMSSPSERIIESSTTEKALTGTV